MGNCRRAIRGYRAPHQDFGSCREIGAKTHWGSDPYDPTFAPGRLRAQQMPKSR
jgi:hypothetical protein